jgi:methylated-DNA-[protein]-cysteine S-methyltransferase
MLDSPVGRLKVVATDQGLAGILWANRRPRLDGEVENSRHPVIVETGRQLEEYFAGRRQEFSLPLDLAGTPFQRRVWGALLTIPFGETRSYAQIAQQIGNAAAVRAVGAANGSNPVAIVAPCHRVIGSSGAHGVRRRAGGQGASAGSRGRSRGGEAIESRWCELPSSLPAF